MTYGIYKNIRDAVWLCLIDNDIKTLPIPIISIANKYNIYVLKHSQTVQNYLKADESGTTIFVEDKIIIIYRDTESLQRCRFTIAHELGHILLGHELTDDRYLRKFDISKPEIEIEADVFASRLLAPACVLWGLNLHTADEIAKACNITKESAQLRANRMATLYQRNKFLTSPLEKKVFNSFGAFIDQNKKHFA